MSLEFGSQRGGQRIMILALEGAGSVKEPVQQMLSGHVHCSEMIRCRIGHCAHCERMADLEIGR